MINVPTDCIGTTGFNVVCPNDPAQCLAGVCNPDETCGLVYQCPPNNACYNFTCNQGNCTRVSNAPTNDPCTVYTCLTDANGVLTLVSEPKCPLGNTSCYSYQCNQGNCTKTPINLPSNLSACDVANCTNDGWVISTLSCPDFPEYCMEGQCYNGQCILISTCASSGCVTRSCVNGTCLQNASDALCPPLGNSLIDCTPATCDSTSGLCQYTPCTSKSVCDTPECRPKFCVSPH